MPLSATADNLRPGSDCPLDIFPHSRYIRHWQALNETPAKLETLDPGPSRRLGTRHTFTVFRFVRKREARLELTIYLYRDVTQTRQHWCPFTALLPGK